MADSASLPTKRNSRRLWWIVLALVLPPTAAIVLLGGWVWVREHSFTPPPIVEPTPLPRGLALRLAAVRMFDEEPYASAITNGPKVSLDDPAHDPFWPQMRETADKNREAMAQLHAALATECWIPAPIPGEDGVGMRNGAKLRRAARVLSMVARYRWAQGDGAGAVDALLDGVHLAIDLRRGRDPIAACNGEGQLATHMRIAEVLARRLDAASARRLAVGLEALLRAAPSPRQQMAWQEPLLSAEAAGPRTWPQDSSDWFVGLMSKLSPNGRMSRTEEVALRTRLRWQTVQAWWSLVSMPSPRERYQRSKWYLGALAVELDKPYGQQRQPGHQASPTETYWHARYRDPLSTASCRLVLTMAALRCYRLEHGAFPDRLTELVPGILQSVPVDPFDRQPLRYRRDGDNWRLWSVGPDCVDNAGQPFASSERTLSNNAGAVARGEAGDIVVRLGAE